MDAADREVLDQLPAAMAELKRALTQASVPTKKLKEALNEVVIAAKVGRPAWNAAEGLAETLRDEAQSLNDALREVERAIGESLPGLAVLAANDQLPLRAEVLAKLQTLARTAASAHDNFANLLSTIPRLERLSPKMHTASRNWAFAARRFMVVLERLSEMPERFATPP